MALTSFSEFYMTIKQIILQFMRAEKENTRESSCEEKYAKDSGSHVINHLKLTLTPGTGPEKNL